VERGHSTSAIALIDHQRTFVDALETFAPAGLSLFLQTEGGLHIMSVQMHRRDLLMGLAGIGLLPAAAHAQQRTFAFNSGAIETGWLPFDLHRGMQVHFTAFSGGRPVRTFLDTGVSGLVIDRAYAERVGMPLGRGITANAISGKTRA
jgi:predicted aspartyl protease